VSKVETDTTSTHGNTSSTHTARSAYFSQLMTCTGERGFLPRESLSMPRAACPVTVNELHRNVDHGAVGITPRSLAAPVLACAGSVGRAACGVRATGKSAFAPTTSNAGVLSLSSWPAALLSLETSGFRSLLDLSIPSSFDIFPRLNAVRFLRALEDVDLACSSNSTFIISQIDPLRRLCVLFEKFDPSAWPNTLNRGWRRVLPGRC
jgi:hypothetical protein